MIKKLIYSIKDEDRFWSKVFVQGEDDCWPYTEYCDHDGYGQFSLNKGKCLAHRLAYIIKYGYTDLQICHSCDNPPCCNPKHLFAGSNQDNIRDLVRKGRHSSLMNFGEAGSNAVLTEAKIKEIRSKHALGCTQATLATEYNVHKVTIFKVVNRKTWKHI